MPTARAIDKLKQAFSVEERSSYSIFKGEELILKIFWSPLTIADRDTINSTLIAMNKGQDEGSLDFALQVIVTKAEDETGTKMFTSGDLPALRRDWILDRDDIEEYSGRESKPEDNGYLSKEHSRKYNENKNAKNRLMEYPGLRRDPLKSTGKAPVTELQYARAGIITKMMRNPDFRIDYGTITSCHMLNPDWDKPLVTISSNRNAHYYSEEVMNAQASALGEACAKAIEQSGKRVVLISSHSLSHRHFVTESPLPEDMSKEHITSHAMHLWDMRMIDYMKSGQCQRLIDEMPEFTEQAIAETDGGAFTWLLSTLEVPDYPAILHGYGTIIGTGNAIVEWPVYQHKRE